MLLVAYRPVTFLKGYRSDCGSPICNECSCGHLLLVPKSHLPLREPGFFPTATTGNRATSGLNQGRVSGVVCASTPEIRHIDGARSAVVDALSRPSSAHLQLSPGIDLTEMATEIRRELPLTTGNGTILCDVSTPSHHPLVPPALRRKVLSSLHDLYHPGSQATGKLVSDRFVWPGMHKELKAWTRACPACQRSKFQRHKKTSIGIFPSSGARFSHIQLDIVGPLSLSDGCSYLLTCVNRFTWWPDAIPLPVVAASTVVKTFLSLWVAVFGAPSTITTDRGAQFESKLFQSLLSFLGCTRLKTSLRATDNPENWMDHLPLVLLGIRSALKSDLHCSTAELVFGATVRLPDSLPSSTQAISLRVLATCSHVYLRCDQVRCPLEPPYNGSFPVFSRGTKTFRIQRETHEEVVTLDHLEAAVPGTPPDKPCSSLPSGHPPLPPSIPPSRILTIPLNPHPPTATSSSTCSPQAASHTHSSPPVGTMAVRSHVRRLVRRSWSRQSAHVMAGADAESCRPESWHHPRECSKPINVRDFADWLSGTKDALGSNGLNSGHTTTTATGLRSPLAAAVCRAP
ncbi:unnamed protein product [Schistocephalus solidus]|uniref:Integrase catalytic domain-containing protein n=1 Tax=Schistocephalus solidus TaxID=70667 RepID=A0A183SMF1_SCHSO|nr:unnamed protein product [Schistocephalus solidus]